MEILKLMIPFIMGAVGAEIFEWIKKGFKEALEEHKQKKKKSENEISGIKTTLRYNEMSFQEVNRQFKLIDEYKTNERHYVNTRLDEIRTEAGLKINRLHSTGDRYIIELIQRIEVLEKKAGIKKKKIPMWTEG